jgi:hypothetical protein
MKSLGFFCKSGSVEGVLAIPNRPIARHWLGLDQPYNKSERDRQPTDPNLTITCYYDLDLKYLAFALTRTSVDLRLRWIQAELVCWL